MRAYNGVDSRRWLYQQVIVFAYFIGLRLSREWRPRQDSNLRPTV
jgi:hypothetical protein